MGDIEIITNTDNKYVDTKYVVFNGTDKCIWCDMGIYQKEDGTQGKYVGALLYDYGAECGNEVELICDYYDDAYEDYDAYEDDDDYEDERCIIIDTEGDLDMDYNTFEFNNVESYKMFGTYANAVMTAILEIMNK